MNNLVDSLTTLAARGTPRGADEVFAGALSAIRNEQKVAERPVEAVTPASAATEDGAAITYRRGSTVRPSRSRRRWVVAIAAVAVVAVGVVGVLRIWDRPTGPAPGAPAPRVPGQWSSFPAPPLSPRFQYLSVATSDGLFVWGGYSNQRVSDGAYWSSTTSQWRMLPSAPIDTSQTSSAIGAWTGAEVVVVNGADEKQAAAFDPATFTWRELPSPLDRVNGDTSYDRLYAVGGSVAYVHLDASAGNLGIDRLDLTTSTWSPAASIPGGLAASSSIRTTASSTDIFVLVTPADPPAPCSVSQPIWRYDIGDDVWTLMVNDTPFSSWRPALFTWAGTGVLVAGGTLCNLRDTVPYAALLDPVATSTWNTVASAPLGITDFLDYDSGVWTGNQVVSLESDGHPVLYDPSQNTWDAGPTFLVDGHHFAMTPSAWVDGQLVIWSAGLKYDETDDGYACCHPQPEAWAYTPPPPVSGAESAPSNVPSTPPTT